MQKKIIALAIAGLASTAAFAQSNVTVYGIVDAGFAYLNNSNGRDGIAVQSGILAGSRLGFKGTEDLGNGVKAIFTLEQGFNVDDGSQANAANGAFQRQAFVGLDTKVGTVTMGRQYAPGYYATAATDALAAALISAQHTLQAAGGFTIAPNSNARWNNSINYMSPNMGGFQGQVIYRAGEQSNDMASNEGYGVGLSFAGGPVAVRYVYQHTDTNATGTTALWAGANGGIQDEHFIGGVFDAKVVKVLATAQMADWGGKGASQNNTATMYALGAIVPVGKGNIHGNVAFLDLNGRAGGASGQGTSYAVAYTHALSKRTVLYTGVNYTDLSGSYFKPGYTGAAGSNIAGNDNVANLVNGGGNGTTVGFGINHSF